MYLNQKRYQKIYKHEKSIKKNQIKALEAIKNKNFAPSRLSG